MGTIKVNHLICPIQPALSVDTTGNGNKGPMRPAAYQNSAFNSNGSYNRGTQSTYHDPRYGFDGVHSPIPWVDNSVYSNGMARNNTNTAPLSNANGFASKINTSIPILILWPKRLVIKRMMIGCRRVEVE